MSFDYVPETFDIEVGSNKYSINIAKLGMLQTIHCMIDKMNTSDVFQTKNMDEIYDIIRLILGAQNFDAIFKDNLYDILYLAEFLNYVSKESIPYMEKVQNRTRQMAQKYGTENLNEPVNRQPADLG